MVQFTVKHKSNVSILVQLVSACIDESNCAQNEDSSAVVSSTQDVEKVAGRYHQMPGIQVISRQVGGNKLVAPQLGTYDSSLGSNPEKYKKGRHKQMTGQHNLARKKNIVTLPWR